MSSALRSRKHLRLVAVTTTAALLVVSAGLFMLGSVWTQYDFKVLDLFYRQAVKRGHGSKPSPQVVFVTITDRTYDHFAKNTLDRKDLAEINDALARLAVQAVAYDAIFARPSNADSDKRFAESIKKLGCAYLPVGLGYDEKAAPFRWEGGQSYERFRSDHLRKLIEKGAGRPFHAVKALMQLERFQEAAFNSGHISAYSDPDGVHRHMIMLLKVGESYFPSLALSMYLDYVKVPFQHVIINWGKDITIPAVKGGHLEKDVVIPIDDRGLAFIPFPAGWEGGFRKMEAQTLLKHSRDNALQGNLDDFFEGRFVLIGDTSVGTSDLGHIPLDNDVPLIMTHASMLGGLLNNRFYDRWTFPETLILLWAIGIALGFCAAMRSSRFLYLGGAVCALGVVGFTWLQFTGFHLFPIATAGATGFFIFLSLLVSLEVATGKERSFIRGAFARYVPAEVVDTLLENPDMLKLGGEERVMTVLFSDLADFTAISERLLPARLVQLLNLYLTEMTEVILSESGIIDKYEGDAIMAEFGAPIPLPDHADRAVRAGLRMQSRLKELNAQWGGEGLPELRFRVGINTGPMIVGNMGSRQVFDYTVIGDAVNLAARLEGANKRYNTCLMISESTMACLTPDRFRTRVLDVVKVKGRSTPVKVYEVYGETSDPVDSSDEAYCKTYQEAFEAYLSRDFGRAAGRFKEALALRPDDPAAKDMIQRIASMEQERLPSDWDGAIALTDK